MNRRNALKTLPLAAMAASLPTLATGVSADDELIRLGEQFEAAWAYEDICREKALPESTAESWEPWDRAYERTGEIVAQIEKMPAHTLEGIRVKARCVQWCYGHDEIELGWADTTDNRLANQILQDILNMGGAT